MVFTMSTIYRGIADPVSILDWLYFALPPTAIETYLLKNRTSYPFFIFAIFTYLSSAVAFYQNRKLQKEREYS